MVLRVDAVLVPGVYHLPRGISIDANEVTLDGLGALLWTKRVQRFSELFPESRSSYDWTIEDNTFTWHIAYRDP